MLAMASHPATITIDPDAGAGKASSVEILGGDLVPIVVILAVAVTYCMKYFFAYRARRDAQASIQTALERGQALTPEILDRLVHPGDQPRTTRNTDLRRGVIGIMLGIGLGAIGLVVGDSHTIRVMLGIGLVPLLVGMAYVALWRFDTRPS
jgi:hypothetical protein